MGASKQTRRRRAIIETALACADAAIGLLENASSELVDKIIYEEFHRTGVDMTKKQILAEMKRVRRQLSKRRQRILDAIKSGHAMRAGWWSDDSV